LRARHALVGAALAALCAAGILVLARAGEDEREPPASPRAEATPTATETPAPTATPTPTPEPTPEPPPPLWEQLETRGKKLAAGITEPHPAFVTTADGFPQPFERWRRALGRIRPALYRLILYWPALQPSPEAPPDLAALNGGCMRDKEPCFGYYGVRDQVRALGSRQRRPGGAEVLVVVAGTPAWAARPPSGCERRRIEPENRMPRTDALPAYRRLVRAVLRIAREEGVTLRYWAPWNEPNHPYSSSPQRAYCSGAAPSVSIGPYVEVARALRDALDRAPGDQRYVLGEVAVMIRRLSVTTTVNEFVSALPRGLVCGAAAWTQHSYLGGEEVLDDVMRLLDDKGCDRRHAVWMTETGAGAPRTATARTGGRGAELRGCLAVHRQLKRWYRDRRVTAAVQYTLREDDLFPTGLVTTALDRPYPALREWQQWGLRARPQIDDPPPSRPRCG
jgi:hypothetical protein